MFCANDVKVSYDGARVLDGVSISVERGKILALIGRSGCGKSTLLRTLCALQKADSGDVFLEGECIISQGLATFEGWAIRRDVSMVGQGPCLLPHRTAIDNISIALRRVKCLPKGQAKKAARGIALEFGLGKVLNSYPEELSGGELQRVQLARAVVLDPKVLLLDEVTSSLDPQTTQEVTAALRRIRALGETAGRAVIIVTHLLQFACEFADRVAFLHNGRIYEEGDAKIFASGALKEETKRFLASVT